MGKKPVIGLAGCFLAAAALAGCQNSRSNLNSNGGQSLVRDNTSAQSQPWNTRPSTGGSSWGNNNTSMANRGTGFNGGTPVAQSSMTGTGNGWGNPPATPSTSSSFANNPSSWPSGTGTPTTSSVTTTGGWTTQNPSLTTGAGNPIVPPGPPVRGASSGFGAAETTPTVRSNDTTGMPDSLNVAPSPASRTTSALPASMGSTGTYSDPTPRTEMPATGPATSSGMMSSGIADTGNSGGLSPSPAPTNEHITNPPAQPEQFVPVRQ